MALIRLYLPSSKTILSSASAALLAFAIAPGASASPALAGLARAEASWRICPQGMTLMIRAITGTRYCVGSIIQDPSNPQAILSDPPAILLDPQAPLPQAGRSAQPLGSPPGRRAPAAQGWQPPASQTAPSSEGLLPAPAPASCPPGQEMRAPHMLSSTLECLPIRCRDGYILEAGSCYLDGHSPSQALAHERRMAASPPAELYCPEFTSMVLNTYGYTWLCKPDNDNGYPAQREHLWPVAKNRVIERIEAANSGLGAGRGCSPQIDWAAPNAIVGPTSQGGFCRAGLGTGHRFDASGNIQHGYSVFVDRVVTGGQGSVRATCQNGVWQLSEPVCSVGVNTAYLHGGTYNEAQDRLNADVEARRKANADAVYAEETAKTIAARRAALVPKIEQALAVARDPSREINERIGSYNQAHEWLEDGKRVEYIGPRCQQAILESNARDSDAIRVQQAIIDNPRSSAQARGAAAEAIFAIRQAASTSWTGPRGPVKDVCDSERERSLLD